MFGDSSSDDEPLTRANSGPKMYAINPIDKVYALKVIDGESKKKFEYCLVGGKELPYECYIEGYQFKFQRDLSVSMVELGWKQESSKKFIVFS